MHDLTMVWRLLMILKNSPILEDVWRSILLDIGRHSKVQYSIVQYSIVQYSTVQYSTVQYSTVHGTVPQGAHSAAACVLLHVRVTKTKKIPLKWTQWT